MPPTSTFADRPAIWPSSDLAAARSSRRLWRQPGQPRPAANERGHLAVRGKKTPGPRAEVPPSVKFPRKGHGCQPPSTRQTRHIGRLGAVPYLVMVTTAVAGQPGTITSRGGRMLGVSAAHAVTFTLFEPEPFCARFVGNATQKPIVSRAGPRRAPGLPRFRPGHRSESSRHFNFCRQCYCRNGLTQHAPRAQLGLGLAVPGRLTRDP